jgi:hypothetical protein
MGFFDKAYSYSIPSAEPLWNKARNFILDSELKPLWDALKQLMQDVLSQKTEPAVLFEDLPGTVTDGYRNAFSTQKHVGEYSKEFWLSVSDLNTGTSGALFRGISEGGYSSIEDLFSLALNAMDGTTRDLTDIQIVEPFLAEIDFIFSLMLSQKTMTLIELSNLWQEDDDRTLQNLQELAKRVKEDSEIKKPLGSLGRSRLESLLQIQQCNTFKAIIRKLIKYHNKIMDNRGQVPWVTINESGVIKCRIRTRKKPDRKFGEWVHGYYIPQFKNLIDGLEGNSDKPSE